MKLRKKILYIANIAILLFVPVAHVYAQGGLQNPLRFGSLDQFLTALLDVMVQIAFPIIVLAVIYTGFLFVSARGNKDKLEEAKRAFLWTVIGGLIVLGAAALSKAIEGTVNQLRADNPAIHLVLEQRLDKE